MNKKLTSLLLLLLAVFAAPAQNAGMFAPRWAATNSATLWGVVVSSDEWGWYNKYYGVYSFNSQMNGDLQEVYTDNVMNANFSGTINDQTLYFTSQYYDENYQTHYAFFVYDTNTWEQLECIEVYDKSFLAADMTADPTTGDIYGCFYNQEGSAFELAKIDHRTYERTVVSTTCFEGQERASGLAFNADGQLYCISLNGNLYKMDKASGTKTLVGSTDITPDATIQSAAFDYVTGKLYWACTSDEETMLCEVDANDGVATTLGNFPNNEHVVALYVKGGEAPQGAPAKAEDVTWNFEGGSLSGNVSFRIPTATFANKAMGGTITYTIYVNDEQVATGSALAGTVNTVDVTVKEAGMNKFDLVLSNEAGNSESARQRMWIGNDVPKAPQNVKLSIDDNGLATISWDAPTEGIHGGYINTTALVYDVYRASNGKRVANHVSQTTITDQITSSAITPYSYKVVAYVDEEASEEAVSNTVTWGQGYEIPYSEDFSSEDNFKMFTVVDANEDGQTWYYQKSSWGGNTAAIDLSGDEDDFTNDDWLITPRITLKADRNYLLKFKASISAGDVANSDDPIELYIGQSQDVTAATQIATEPLVKGYTSEQQAVIQVEEDGIYYVMFRMVKTANYGNFRMNNFSIDVNEIFSAPAEVENLNVVAGAEGGKYVDVTFNAPTKNIDGSSIEALAKIEVSRDGEVVKTFEAPATGEALSFRDQSLKEGNHTYVVTPYNAESKGREATATVFVGLDATTAAQNVKVVDNLTDITISWDAPTTSINGGYVDYDNLTYDILYYEGTASWNIKEIPVASDLEETSYTFDPGMTGKQSLRQYVIRTFSDGGYGEEATTRKIILGGRYELPFVESFPKGKAQQDFWWKESASNWLEFEGNTSLSADGDGGSMGIHLGYGTGRISASYNSGKINISTVENPTLTFKYYYTENMTGSWTVNVENADGELKQAFTVDLDNLDAVEGWQMGVVNLNDYKDNKYVVLHFEAATNDKCTTTDLYLDDIKVMNQLENDLQVAAQVGETAVNGAQSTVKATVVNVGATERTDFTVNLYVDGEVVASETGQTLAVGAMKTYNMVYVPSIFATGSLEVYVAVENEGDNNLTNNETEPVSVALTPNTLPTVALQGEAVDGMATLSWTAPETGGSGKTEEGFEDYDANTLDTNFGGWLAVDVDEWDVGGSDSGKIPGDYEDTGTFLVFNPAEALGEDYLDDDDYADYEPFEGEQYVICHGVYYDDEQTDDWLISPELSGKAQTVVFYARGFSYEEDMQVLYSTTDRNVESFTNVVFDQEVTTQWKRYTVKLPQGAKYFAFRMTSWGGDILGIDGVEFESALDGLETTGYNVYRDGQLVATTSNDVLEFTDTEAANGNHTYVVSAQYGDTESMPSNEVTIDVTTGINSLMADGSLTVNGRNIEFNGAGSLAIATPDGRTIYSSNGTTGTVSVPVRRGVYVVTFNGKSQKLIVR